MQSQLLQQLGQQVRQDVQTIQTNRQLQGLAQAAQNVNVESTDFPKQAIGLLSQYPMAAQTPVGAAAISQLGMAHREWAAEQAKISAYNRENAPWVPPVPSKNPSISPTTNTAGPSIPVGGGVRITDYGQSNDSTPDTLTSSGKSAIGQLRPDSMALSPDLEAQMKAQGVKIGTPVKLTLDDGSEVTRFWDDRTAKSYNGRPLTGRVDLFTPGDQANPLRDRAVVAISPAEQLVSDATELQKAGIPITQKGMRAAGQAFLSSSARTSAKAQNGEDLTAGMQPVPEHGTYRGRDGMEYFVSRSSNGAVKLAPYKPTTTVAKRFGQGSDGRVYAFGSDGEPMQPIPDGVSIELNPGKVQTTKDNLGNVYQLHRDSSVSLLIPANLKLTTKDRDSLIADTEAFNTAKAEYETKKAALEEKGARGLHNWFGVSEDSVDQAKKALNSAELKMKSWVQQYPALKSAASTAPATSLSDEDRAISLQRAREAVARKPESRAAVIKRLEEAGITDHGL